MRQHKYVVGEQLVVQVWNTTGMLAPEVITLSDGVEGRLVATRDVDGFPKQGDLILANPLTSEQAILHRAWNSWITMADSDRARFNNEWHIYAGDALYRAGVDPTPHLDTEGGPL